MFETPQKVVALQKECPDLVNPFEHLHPKNLALRSLFCAGLVGGEVALQIHSHYQDFKRVEGTHDDSDNDEDEQAVQRAEANFHDHVARIVSAAPAGVAFSIVRDILIRSTHRALEMFLVYNAQVPLCRKLTTNVNNEFKRQDEKRFDAEHPSIGSVILSTAAANVLVHAAVFAVDTTVDIWTTLQAAVPESKSDVHKKSQTAVARRAARRYLLAAGTLALESVLVGVAYKVSTSTKSKWTSMSTLGSVAMLVGGNLLYLGLF